MPDFTEELGDTALFDLWCPPNFKNLFNSDIDPLVGSAPPSSFSRIILESFFELMFFLSPRRSAELRHGLGKVVVDDDGEVLFRLFRPLNTNRGSMESRFLDCGGRLFDA